jgi:ligand-binding SRPBCC domain-containing protein
MLTFEKSVILDWPVEEVFAFHERPDALALLSPPFPPVKLVKRTGMGIEAGSRVELRVGVLRWIAHHTQYERNRLFVDEQVAGPFAHWVHRHEFEALGQKTRLTDRIEFQLPGGAVGNALLGWAAQLTLRNMFAHRHRATREALGGAKST